MLMNGEFEYYKWLLENCIGVFLAIEMVIGVIQVVFANKDAVFEGFFKILNGVTLILIILYIFES